MHLPLQYGFAEGRGEWATAPFECVTSPDLRVLLVKISRLIDITMVSLWRSSCPYKDRNNCFQVLVFLLNGYFVLFLMLLGSVILFRKLSFCTIWRENVSIDKPPWALATYRYNKVFLNFCYFRLMKERIVLICILLRLYCLPSLPYG